MTTKTEGASKSMTPTATGAARLTTPNDRDVVVERTFDAQRQRVFRALTDPKAIPTWWGPQPVVVDKMDVRPGGTWRFIETDADGDEHAFHGVYREVTPPSRIVATFVYEGWPETEVLETYTLEEQGARTRLRLVAHFPDQASRDRMVKSGMETGVVASWDRLATRVEG